MRAEVESSAAAGGGLGGSGAEVSNLIGFYGVALDVAVFDSLPGGRVLVHSLFLTPNAVDSSRQWGALP